ncbi:MAG TPA: beta-eliminating lyase-related protein, partial [Candidatus Limnocylindrales bacterium]|nr:beta-eliminating lyase-related protein [Candidatus Limnocylindrales bacterium]
QALSGVGFRTVSGDGGRIEPADVEQAMTMAGFFPRIGLMVWENTHNMSGGRVIPIDLMEKTSQVARAHGLRIHVDGARIFNAVVASGVPADRYAAVGDTIQFCFSKGLGAPVGSVLLGSRDFLKEARSVALRIGGGMRQAGIVAAGGLYALKHHVGRLEEDHANARRLAAELDGIPTVEVINAPVATNIVVFRWKTPSMGLPAFRERIAGSGMLLDDRGFPLFRAVIHMGIGKREISRVARALREIFAGGERRPPTMAGDTPQRAGRGRSSTCDLI